MAQKEDILKYIQEKTTFANLRSAIESNSQLGVSAYDIEKKFCIIRNNSSTLLNKLNKESYLIKIISRPVTFIHVQNLVQFNLKNSSYKLETLKNHLIKHQNIITKNDFYDPFNKLVGHSSSLLNQITKAKAAILYPPTGLNTLILGESGVGKTTFANAMYEFAKLHKTHQPTLPFISFNCADYFNNPHLLLSQLFGHIKGAFTGADSDKEGLVEKANNGILFLDEIHRLSADGQEMLFYLMDNGKFNRLGETNKIRQSNVLIIAATTENPSDVLLNTFLRRIPVTLKLPSFSERNINEKIELIKNIFLAESYKLKSSIFVDSDILKALCFYDFSKGNLGQLFSEIKLLCAKGFLNLVKNNHSKIDITFNMVNKEIISHYHTLDTVSKNFYNFNKNKIEFNSTNLTDVSSLQISTVIDDNIYERISNKLCDLNFSNFSEKDINEQISLMISSHYRDISNKFNNTNINLDYLDKIIDQNISTFSESLINYATEKLKVTFSDKFIILLSMHIQSLINRLLKGIHIKKINLKNIQEKNPKEFEVAKYFSLQIEQNFNLNIPEDEKGFLTILLSNNQNSLEESDIGIIVLCHGESTATSMCNVANEILDSNLVHAIDMPLSSSIKECHDKLLKLIKSMKYTSNILLLADMGSLTNIANEIMKETNITIKTICNVSTLTVIEALRQILLKNYSIDEIYDNLNSTFYQSTIVPTKKNALITLCATGKGSSIIAKNIISDIFKNDIALKNIEIISIEYENHLNSIAALENNYNILACIGNLKIRSNLPFFPISNIFLEDFDIKFKKFLVSKLNSSKISNIPLEHTEDIFDKSVIILSKYVKYINPSIAINSIKKFIISLDKMLINQDYLIDLVLHIGCMMDRCIKGHFAIFEDKINFISKIQTEFTLIKSSFRIIENDFDIQIPDDEICFTIQVLKR